MSETTQAEPAKKQHGGKRAGAGRKKGAVSVETALHNISRAEYYRNKKIASLTLEARDWLRIHWSGGRRATADRATERALLLAARYPDAESQIAALTFLREQRQARRYVTILDLVEHVSAAASALKTNHVDAAAEPPRRKPRDLKKTEPHAKHSAKVETPPPLPSTESYTDTDGLSVVGMHSVQLLAKQLVDPFRDDPFDESAIEALKHSIRKRGITEPVVVYRPELNVTVLIAGRHIKRAAMELGIKEIPCLYLIFNKKYYQDDNELKALAEKAIDQNYKLSETAYIAQSRSYW